MHIVEPIRKVTDIKRIKRTLAKSSKRNRLLFELGINTGLRISDILKLRVEDVENKKYIFITEQKTRKRRKIVLSNSISLIIRKYIKDKNADEYLFSSRKGHSCITRIQAYRIIRDVCKKLEIKATIGTHTMRKTFGYHFYKKTKDVVLLQNILNHSSPNITLRYIGVNQDIIDSSLKRFVL